jgi:hypothetical protein
MPVSDVVRQQPAYGPIPRLGRSSLRRLGPALPRERSDPVPLLPLLTLEGGRPRSRVENKISTQSKHAPSADLDFLFGMPP